MSKKEVVYKSSGNTASVPLAGTLPEKKRKASNDLASHAILNESYNLPALSGESITFKVPSFLKRSTNVQTLARLVHNDTENLKGMANRYRWCIPMALATHLSVSNPPIFEGKFEYSLYVSCTVIQMEKIRMEGSSR